MENARLPRCNSRWRDPCNEATDSLRLSDGVWHCGQNCLCNPPWGLIDDLVIMLRTSMVIVFPPSPDLFAPGRLGVRAGVGPPKWPVVAFGLPLRAPGMSFD
eukprot:jgi/Tetstr1/429502/TSEL_019407.t1